MSSAFFRGGIVAPALIALAAIALLGLAGFAGWVASLPSPAADASPPAVPAAEREATLAALMLAGCATHFSTVLPDNEGVIQKYAYHAPMDSLLADVYEATLFVLPGRKLEKVDGISKGYTTWTRFMLDTYTQQVLLTPVKGVTAEGQEVDAWALDVSGEGSSGSGRLKNIDLWKTIKARLDAKYPRVNVR